VASGKLSFTLGTPGNEKLGPVSNLNGDDDSDFFGKTDSGYELTIPEPTAKYAVFQGFGKNIGQNSYKIQRIAEDTDGATYMDYSIIVYVYVDKDVTLSRDAKSWTDNGETVSYTAINLPLIHGWNLVQTDLHQTETSATVTVKIADKNVPWTVTKGN
jgi:hypothetical protein